MSKNRKLLYVLPIIALLVVGAFATPSFGESKPGDQEGNAGMVDFKAISAEAAARLGKNIEFQGMVSKSAVFHHVSGMLDDIVGWNYVVHTGHGCMSFYAAQAPRIGMSTPQPIRCPIGVMPFDNYRVPFYEAIPKVEQECGIPACGVTIIEMTLSEPLAPTVHQPLWNIAFSNGDQALLGADDDTIIHCVVHN